MIYISHRVNTAEQLRAVPPEHGVELDLRDWGDEVVVQHDPFTGGERFADYLRHYRHRTMILNVKSERIEPRVLELVRAAGVSDYFFLDCSFPMVRWLIARGERRIAARFSEHEPAEAALALAGEIDWVWVDCFRGMPLTDETYERLKRHFKLCVVSPELHGRPVETIAPFAEALRPYPVEAVCTKRPDLWRAATGG
jgi:hypothetical protein